ncbi:MAG: pilus assembly protein PilF [Propionivibrio sp.]|nr:pilus assembly protein PilF [Propionivibrio sp.]
MPPSLPFKTFGQIVLGVIAIALVVTIYWPGLYGGFFFDDEANLHQLSEIGLNNLSLAAVRQSMTNGIAGPLGRPISLLSFALNHLFSDFNPFAYKLTNLIIHSANSILVFFLVLQLSSTTNKFRPNSHSSALMAGLVAFAWLIHPIQLTSVLYVVQRMTSLSAFFLLMALWLHIVARERGGPAGIIKLIVAWCILWPLSAFSKETGLLFPLFVLAWELILRRHAHQGLDRFSRSLLSLSVLGIVGSAIYMLTSAGSWLWAGYDLRPFSLVERLLTEGRVLCFYIGLILFPRLNALGLYHDDFSLSTSLLTPWTTLPALALLTSLVWFIWRTKNTRPLVSLGIAWFLVGHLMESTVLPLEIAHEHRNYLPLLGILLAGADMLMRSLELKGVQKTIAISLTVVVLAYLMFITALRAHQFGDNVRLTQIEAEYHQGSSRAQYEAGRVLAEMPGSALPNLPLYAFAQKYYEQATRLDSHAKLGLLGLINLACKAGKTAEKSWFQELEHRLRTPPFSPGDRNVLYSLKEMSIAGTLCLSRSDIDSLFTAALANPGVTTGVKAILLSWHADYLWLHEHDMAAAREALGRSLLLNPANPSNRLKWAQLLFIAGERDQARQLLIKLRDVDLSAEERKTIDELLSVS